MKLTLNRIILFVNNVDKLKKFYVDCLNLELIEEIASEWVVLKAGACEIGLHRVGLEHRVSEDEEFKVDSNAKLVFQIDEHIAHTANTPLPSAPSRRATRIVDARPITNM